MDNYLLLYSHCIISKGSGRATIIDLQRQTLHFIPLSFANLFLEGRYLNVSDIFKESAKELHSILLDYIDYIQKNELVYLTSSDELCHFPPMPDEWFFPAHITNCVLDTNGDFEYFNVSFLNQLEVQCCNFVQFRYFNEITVDSLQQLMDYINPSQIKSIEIVMPEQKHENFYDELRLFVEKNRKISNCIVSGASENAVFLEGNYGMGFIVKTTTKIVKQTHCGIIDSSLFTLNIQTYTESLAHNTCLNRKIAIDVEGNIKNCPSMKESFGNIKDTTLEEALNKPGFKKYWNITKDEITKCKDCEFRHVCTDCRAYIENPEDMYSAPLKCGYDPYTCEWEEWSTNPLKQQAIEHYGMQELVKKA